MNERTNERANERASERTSEKNKQKKGKQTEKTNDESTIVFLFIQNVLQQTQFLIIGSPFQRVGETDNDMEVIFAIMTLCDRCISGSSVC